jgi:hypothetical protein
VAELVPALFTVCPGMLVNAGFLLSWRYGPALLPVRWGVGARTGAMVGLSVALWAALAGCVMAVNRVALRGEARGVVALGAASCVALTLIGVAACMTPVDHTSAASAALTTAASSAGSASEASSRTLPATATATGDAAPVPPPPPVSQPSPSRTPWAVLACRGVMACASVSVAVLLTTVNDILAGLASTFPAVFLTVMVSLWLSHGAAVNAGAVGPMVLGSLAVSAYSMAFAGIAAASAVGYGDDGGAGPDTGTGPGAGSGGGGVATLHPAVVAILSYLIAVIGVSLPVALFLRWRKAVNTRRKARLPVLLRQQSSSRGLGNELPNLYPDTAAPNGSGLVNTNAETLGIIMSAANGDTGVDWSEIHIDRAQQQVLPLDGAATASGSPGTTPDSRSSKTAGVVANVLVSSLTQPPIQPRAGGRALPFIRQVSLKLFGI